MYIKYFDKYIWILDVQNEKLAYGNKNCQSQWTIYSSTPGVIAQELLARKPLKSQKRGQ